MPTPVRKRSDGLETMEIVKKFARTELDKYGAVKFNLDRVLEKSGISRSSVYHHFGSRDGLIATVEVDRYFDDMIEGMETLRSFFLGSDDLDEVFAYIEIALRADDTKAAAQRRRRRIALIAAAEHNKGLAAALARAQVVGSAHLAETLEMMTSRGFFRPQAPVAGIAYLVQSIFMGRILVDLGREPDRDGEWVEAAMVALRALVS